MWLINTDTYDLELFFNENAPPYAILSHRWEDGEITFQEMNSKGDSILKKGYRKVMDFCEVAKKDGYSYGWVDTCCIDKSSSAELSEAINSMFTWYRNSDICYAYLSDVPELYSVRDPSWMGLFDVKGIFKSSMWFARGWTLQELVAPSVVEFYTADWKPIGTKAGLEKEIADITGINPRALSGENLLEFNIAERMSWAASRTTTRLEDKAYSLLGIFQINMPLLYGEGSRAFLRLQEEILRATEDYTIFAWPGAVEPANAFLVGRIETRSPAYSFLASDTSEFRRLKTSSWHYSDLVHIPEEEVKAIAYLRSRDSSTRDVKELGDLDSDDDPPTITGRGLRVCLPLTHIWGQEYLAATYYKIKQTGEWLCIPLTRNKSERQRFSRNSSVGIELVRINLPQIIFKRCTIYGERFNDSASKTNPKSNVCEKVHELFSAEDYELAMKLATRLYGSQHPTTLDLVIDVMQKYLVQNRYEDAELLGLELLPNLGAGLGGFDKRTLRAKVYLATAISKQGRWDAAEEIFQDFIKKYDWVEGETQNWTIICKIRYAENMFNQKPYKGRLYFKKVMDHFEQHINSFQSDRRSARDFIDSLRRGWSGVKNDRKEMVDVLAEVSKKVQGEKDPVTLFIILCQKIMDEWNWRTDEVKMLVGELRSLLGETHKLVQVGEVALDLRTGYEFLWEKP